MVTIDVGVLRSFTCQVIAATGTPPDLAEIVGNSLVDANLVGHDSHGVLRLAGYARAVANDDVHPAVYPSVTKRDRATVTVDGAWGWGQPAMRLATETAIELAKEFGIAIGVVNRCYHIGRVAPYVESIARAGLVGIAMANAGPAVAPYGGRRRVLGTNPFAWAVPRGPDKDPVSFDIATSGVAEGKLQVAMSKGMDVAPGLIVDVDGHPSTDPAAFYAGGALLPFGGHKGYGINVLAQMLGRGLAGMDLTRVGDQDGMKRFDGPRGANGPVVIAIDVSPFAALEQFASRINEQCELITDSEPMDGFERVYLPGELELASQKTRNAEGISLPDKTWSELIALRERLGVPTTSLQSTGVD